VKIKIPTAIPRIRLRPDTARSWNACAYDLSIAGLWGSGRPPPPLRESL